MNHNNFKPPTAWRRLDVLTASFLINILALGLPFAILQVYDRIIPKQAIDTFIFIIIGLIGVILLDTLVKIARSSILSWEGAKYDHKQSMKAVEHILHADTSSYESKPHGYYIDKIHALEKIQDFYSGQSILLMMDFPFVIIFIILIWFIAGPLVIIPLCLLGFFGLISILTGQRLHKALVNRSEMEDRRQNFIIEVLSGIHTVKAMAMEPFMIRRYERLQGQSAESIFQLSRINSIVQGIGATFSQVATISFVGIGSLSVIEGDLTLGALAAGSMLSNRVLQPGLKAMSIWTQFQSVRLAHKKVKELFAMPSERSGTISIDQNFEGSIQLENLSFQYPNTEQPILTDVSLDINDGEMIGITGNNGSGKSTIIKLLAGYIHPNKGELLINNHPISEYNLEQIRTQIGIVPQYGILFEGTILENMTLYREGDAIKQAIELSKILGLEKIIAQMPHGLDTMVGGSAVDSLSEGVRQKIIMVRSLVGYPKIILFDDANANFDIKNDNRLMNFMSALRDQRTMVIVSHRPSFLKLCHRVYLINDHKLHLVEDVYNIHAGISESNEVGQ